MKKYRLYRSRIKKLSRFCDKTDTLCPECNRKDTFYYFRFDAEFCYNCNQWLEEKCPDPLCSYCSKRPDTPLEGLWAETYRDSFRKDNLKEKYYRRLSGKIKHEKQ
ncbi:MAG: hypothetical protein K2J40_06795 [Ruminococcus sp.]|nr:hypothetical protein [Ruminococcus sp.]